MKEIEYRVLKEGCEKAKSRLLESMETLKHNIEMIEQMRANTINEDLCTKYKGLEVCKKVRIVVKSPFGNDIVEGFFGGVFWDGIGDFRIKLFKGNSKGEMSRQQNKLSDEPKVNDVQSIFLF